MARIQTFKEQVRNGGARSNQFTVSINIPPQFAGGDANRAISFLVNATSLPAVSIGNINMPFRGRPVNFAGEREFAPWNVTVINDGDFLVRNAFERWSDAIANFDATNGLVNPIEYQIDMSVIQLDRNGNALKAYKFFDAYPTEIGQIALSYENPQIETFDVTFMYNYYLTSDTGGGVEVPTGAA